VLRFASAIDLRRPRPFMKSKDFLALFEADLFCPGLKASGKVDALTKLVDFLYSKKRVANRQAVLTNLLEREKLCSTGLGKGLAIPHSRSMMVDRLTVLFGSLAKPIDFDSEDKKPVSLVFLVLAPPQDVGNEYLPFLGKLVEVLRDKKNRDALRTVQTFEEFQALMEKAL
jgi:mannitol/fructose-specific phosphotransferase system IIA component (Ntr-type)